jgi:hypothetical protein
MKRSILLGIAIAAALAVLYVIFFRPSDEARIRMQLERLALVVQIDAGEKSPMPRAARIQKEFAKIFTDDARATVEELEESLEGRDALVSAAVQLAGAYTSADVSFDKVTVRINVAAAEARAIAKVTGVRQGQSHKLEEMRVRFTLKKLDGDWKIAKTTVGPSTAHDAPEP